MTTDLTPAEGMTCNFGSGKTIWEVVHIDHGADGKPKQLHLSKAGGDGYTNRWATPGEIRNLKKQTLRVSLAKVLKTRAAAAAAASKLEQAIKLKTNPDQLVLITQATAKAADEYAYYYSEHLMDTTSQTQ